MRPIAAAIAVALAAARVSADDAGPARPQAGTADPHPAQEDRHDIKGYGYGTQPGQEAAAGGQASDPARRKSSAPQDERRASGSAAGRAIVGRVVKASPDRLSIRSGDERVHPLGIDARTKVLRAGEPVAVSDLRAGEEVRAAYQTRGKRRVATTITVVERGARQPPGVTDQERETERRQAGEPSPPRR